MKKLVWCLLILSSLSQTGMAQSTRYIIRFRNKAFTPYSLSAPAAYLSPGAIERRERFHISLDSTDLPVTPRYLDSVRQAGNVKLINVSKWLNAVTIQTTDTLALQKINSFSFVQTAAPVAARIAGGRVDKTEGESPLPLHLPQREYGTMDDFFNYGASYAQVHIHNGEFLHNIGLRGQGMIIGMLDAGFQNYLTVKAFDSARANGQILGIYDFVAHDSSVNEDNAHGMECFSVMAANLPGQLVGTAPKASFYLFRSEDVSSEYPIEEHNWVCAAERVDSVGGSVISSSLGYNVFDNPAFNHSYADMNGNTTMAAIGADLAAKKGILVLNSAGNEGNSTWGKIVTPADGDSVMAVGAVNTAGVAASFSSRGPSSDGRVKPDVASVGVATVVQSPGNTIVTNNGTSFSCPNMAGLATCLWQGFPDQNNMRIIDALRRSANLATHPNDSIGYGIPDVKKAMLMLLQESATSQATVTNCQATLHWKSRDIQTMKYEIERNTSGQPDFMKLAEIPASGSVFGPQSYTYTDDLTDLEKGTITYRIRQVIDTALASFSAGYIDTVSVMLNNACFSGATGITLLPNPTQGPLTLKVVTPNASQNLLIRILNSLGQVVGNIHQTKGPGIAFFDLPVFRLPRGKYYVTVFEDQKAVQTKEFIKL